MLSFVLLIALVVVVAVGLELVPVVVVVVVVVVVGGGGGTTGIDTHVCSRVCSPVSFSSTSSCDVDIGKQTILTSESDG